MTRTWIVCVIALVACNSGKEDGETDVVPLDSDSDTVTVDSETADGDTGTVPDPQATLELPTGPIACAEPELRADAWYTRRAAPTASSTDTILPYDPWVWGSGIVAADFDGDGWTDIFASNESTPNFYRNEAGILADMSEKLAAFDLSLSTGGAAADYDGDGDQDLMVTRYLRANVLLRNDGAGEFTDVTAGAGVAGAEDRRSMSAAWADYDGDDDLDLYIGNYGFIDESLDSSEFLPAEPDYLYVNNGDGTFTDRSDIIPAAAQDGYTYTASWIDLNDDLKPEMYIVNDFGVSYPNTVLWNDGDGTLSMEQSPSGLNGQFTGMGLDVADLNTDGLPDLVVPVWAGIVYLESTTSGFWIESQDVRQLNGDLSKDQKVSWGGNFGDMDNDGDTDLAMQYGYVVVGDGGQWPNPLRQPDALFIQGTDGKFEDQSFEHGFNDNGVTRGAVVTDLNRDGFVDVVKRDLGGPVINGLNIAYMSNCDDAAWLNIGLKRNWGMNRDAIGAKIVLVSNDLATCPAGTALDDGRCQWTGWVQAGGISLGSSEPPSLHFGLATLDRIDKIEVSWPDGRVSVFRDVDTRQFVTIAQDAPTL